MNKFYDIPDYKGIYQINKLCEVKSLKRKGVTKDRILKPSLCGKGYYRFDLLKNKKRKMIKRSVLMAMTFLNHKPNGHTIVVDHINNIRTYDRLENLQLISQRKNCSKDKIGKGSSKYTGVLWHKNMWSARIVIKGEKKYLGRFINEYDAHLAYQKELLKVI